MDDRIIYENPDGSASVIIPTGEISIDAVKAKDVPGDAIKVQIVTINEIPPDRIFRGAWRKKPGKLEVNMPAARIIHMDRIRKERDKELIEQDKAYAIADDANDGPGKAAVQQKRRDLRDIPSTFDLSGFTTPEDLNNAWPVGLPRPAPED